MIYADDEVFNVRYNTKLDRLEIKQERWTSKVIKAIKNNKIISTMIIALILFSIINIAMIYKFMEILQNV